MDVEARAAEMRAAGKSEEEIRGFLRGVQQAEDRFKAWAAKPHPSAAPVQLPSYTAAEFPVRVMARGDRGTWATTTPAGRLASVVNPDQPDAPARELAEARAFVDDWEYRYNRRPSMAEARMAVGRRSDGVVISGTAEQVGRVFAAAGLTFGITSQVEVLPPPGDAVVRRSVA